MGSLLEVSDLVVRFGASFAVGPVSFEMDRGILYLEGPNGGGKTTLMRAMAGELEPAKGAVTVGGRDVHRSVEARRHIALVPSHPELPDFLSIAEAYEFTAALRGARHSSGREYMEQLDLDAKLPLGSASAGQRRKAELLCGLAGDPQVLLLDETFAHLDAESVGKLRDWVNQWAGSKLIVFTHHGTPPVDPQMVLRVQNGQVERARPVS